MKTQHTPAPWHLGMKPGPMVYGPQGEQVANMHVAMLDQSEHIANARLIAAAPELLAALEKITLAYESARKLLYELQGSADNTPLLEEARAAIAKATQG